MSLSSNDCVIECVTLMRRMANVYDCYLDGEYIKFVLLESKLSIDAIFIRMVDQCNRIYLVLDDKVYVWHEYSLKPYIILIHNLGCRVYDINDDCLKPVLRLISII